MQRYLGNSGASLPNVLVKESTSPLPNPLLEGEGTANALDFSLRQYKASPDYVIALAQKLRTQQTCTENIFWEIVRAKRFFQTKWRRQHPFGRYIADFYCHELQLVIEIDGDSHIGKEAEDYDILRTEFIHVYNIQVIRFTNHELLNDLDFVIKTILIYMNELPLLQGEGWGEV